MSTEPKRSDVAVTEVQSRETTPGSVVGRIVAVDGPSRGAAIALVRAQATVGRHPTNDLVLADPRVSAVHLELARRAVRAGVATELNTLGHQQNRS